jgi:CRISPR-associated protein Csd1
MIQELVEFGKRVTKGKNMALKEEPFSIDIVINENGEFQKFIVGERQTIETEVITAKKGKARFLLDKCEEVLGFGNDDAVNKKHQLFLDKLELYKEVQALEPVFKFYEEQNEDGLKKAKIEFDELDKKIKGENITFMVGTTRLLKNEEVREAIIRHFRDNEQMLSNGKVCSICGRSDSPVLDEPHGLVKMPKGQTAGCALVSYNENAFESYGLKGNLNSSICRDCARNYIEGLRFLLSNGREVPADKEKKQKAHFEYNHRIKLSDTTVALFWTKQGTEESPLAVVSSPDASWVKGLFDSVWSGNNIGSTVDTNMFYTCTLSSAAARIAVRDWTALSLDEYKKNLAEWFRDIEIENYERELVYSPLRMLIAATQRDKKPGDKPKSDLNSKTKMGTMLWNAAIKGHRYKLPLEVLQSVLVRIWKGDYFSVERAALIKLIINRNTDKDMSSTLKESNTSVAYLCGRLFAVIESMQWKAMGNVNSGVKERYFAAAALQPAYIFGQLLTKNVTIYQRKIGGYLANELNEIAGKISENGCFPQRFSAIEQGEFALGYYFQRNHKKETTENTNS